MQQKLFEPFVINTMFNLFEKFSIIKGIQIKKRTIDKESKGMNT